MSDYKNEIPRVTGLLIIEVRNSNPNGDPDRESDPRTRAHDGKGVISDVSFKRKLRELVLQKDGPVWQHLEELMALDDEQFGIHVDQAARAADTTSRQGGEKKSLSDRFWDVRLFGSTSLEEGDKFIRSGVAQFAIAVSAAKVRIQRDTNTVKAGVQEGKDRGMAPLGFRVVEHGVYAMPFLINPSAAGKSKCTRKDIELLCRMIPHAYAHNASRIRPFVEVRHAWYFEHSSPLGSCSDFAIIDALSPSKPLPSEPSSSWSEYGYDGAEKLKEVMADKRFAEKFKHFGDLCDSSFVDEVFRSTNG
jgi:CRISPR-associated protein Csd2